MAGHATDINHYCPSAFVQPGAPIVSATLCVGAWRGLTGEELLRAVIVGYEICCRLPKALGIENLQRAGLSSHGIGPLFGTAAAMASLVGCLRRINDLPDTACHRRLARMSGSANRPYREAGLIQRNARAARRGGRAHGEERITGVSDPFSTPFNSWLVSVRFWVPIPI